MAKIKLSIGTETTVESEPLVVSWNNKNLFVGCDNGSILTFDTNLSPGKSWKAHDVQLFALTASEENLYSSSNDGGVKIWSMDGEKVSELPRGETDIESIHLHGNYVYAGDEGGMVYVFENNELKASYNVLEEVKDIAISPPFMFTARDNYVTITEIKPEESKTRFVTKLVMEGRAPLRINESRLVIIGRGGNDLRLHDMDPSTNFKKLDEVKVSGMIITTISLSENFVWTGGWDGCIKRYKIDGDKLKPAGEISLDVCCNALVAVNAENAYVLLSDCRIVHLKV